MIYDYTSDGVVMEVKFPYTVKRQDIPKIFERDSVKPLYFEYNPDGIVYVICSNKVKEKVMGKFVEKGAEVKIIQRD